MENQLYVIYMITNTINGKSYIGKTVCGAHTRWVNHKSAARCGSDYYFHRAIRKYGEDCWSHNTLYIALDKDDLWLYDVEEQLVIDWDTRNNGYNTSVGGVGVGSGINNLRFGVPMSEEHKAKIGNANRGEKHHNYGGTVSEETRGKLIASRRKQGLKSNNTSGIVGVHWDKARNKWKVDIGTNKRNKTLGRFNSKNDAIIARLMAELEHWNQIIIYDY